jgi:hypothetical protein
MPFEETIDIRKILLLFFLENIPAPFLTHNNVIS